MAAMRCSAAFASTLLVTLLAHAQSTSAPVPLPRTHAHNDYLHQRPLFDALEHGFCSVEADIHLVNDQLLIGHDLEATQPGRTLQKLYLDPLKERIRQNGGRVYPNGPTILLLVDVKSEAEPTYRALRQVLLAYADFLSRFLPDKTETNAVSVIISGNRAKALMAAESVRYAACDGRLSDLDSNASPHFIPLVSDNWTTHFQWNGTGPIPTAERANLRRLVDIAHQQGRQIRFWATPDLPTAWSELKGAGVDLINTDNLSGLKNFLLHQAN